MNLPQTAPVPVDLSNCDREPIHLLGGIQPFGFLLALTGDWQIARASANLAAFSGHDAASVLGKALAEVFDREAIHAIRNRMLFLTGPDSVERLFDLALFGDPARRFDVAVHLCGSQIVIEGEPAQRESLSLTGTLRSQMARLDQAADLEKFFREGARQVRVLTGFDRVMVYRFDAEGAGEVVAESTRAGIGSFLGLHYPASDIPAQARALYVRNLFRIIADIDAPPVRLVPQLDENGAPLDLSLAVTRAVSAIHIEYLKNMGVSASLSISIVIDGRLWGLFACHHYSPRLPSLERRSLAEVFGQMYAMKLESRERQLTSEYLARARTVADSLLGTLAGNAELLNDPEWLGETLNRAIESDGMGICIDGRISLAGLAPSESEFLQIVRVLNGTAANRIYAVDEIAKLVPQATQWTGPAAGMLAIPISRSPRDYVVLFRQEQVRTVRWAGDPHKPAEYGPNGPRLTPRKSFETWAEMVKGRSRPFSPIEISMAEMLRTTLIEVVLRYSEESHAERQLAHDRQQLLIAELNHRVRNILSLIGGLVRRSRGNAQSIDDYMRDIDERIGALARAHNQITGERWAGASLRGLIETEVEAYIGGKSTRFALEGPDVKLTPHAFSTLALVFHELVTNSAKYGGLSDSGRVLLSWKLDAQGDLLLHWRESGGPAVQAPTRQGFGSTIIRRSIPYDLGGRAEIKFNLSGVEAHFCIPARHLELAKLPAQIPGVPSPPERVPAAATAVADSKLLEGRTVLLLEDSLLVAIDTEENLKQLGARHITLVATVPQALAEIEREPPALALLDINLGDQTSLPVAERLKELGIPFVFATGYGERGLLPDSFSAIEILQKPYSLEAVTRAMKRLIGSGPKS